MSIRKRDVHFSDWTKVRHALVCNNVQGITETSSFDDVRAFLINSESGSNPFYYYVCYIKETKEIYTHGQFYKCGDSLYDDTELRDLIGTKADLSALEALVSEVAENELVTAKALYDLNDRKLDKSELDNIDLSNYVDLETYNSDLDSINASITNKANQSDLAALSAEVEENEDVTAAALTELHENKADKSEIPDVSTLATNTDLNTKQDLLVSGTNIKTVNGDSILGSGDIEIHDTKVTSAENHYGYNSDNAISTTGAFVTKITKDAANHVTSFESRALTSTDIPGLDASKITSGTIDIARLPKGALEQLHHYETKELAQQAVIDKSVQLGDTVQINNATMYICTNDSATTFATQFTEYVAGTAASVPWSGITGKPTGIDEWGNRIGVIESGYATQSWVENKGYLLAATASNTYQPKITTTNKLAYSLISGTPDLSVYALNTSIPTKLSQLTDDVVAGKYLPITGGTINGTNYNPLSIASNDNSLMQVNLYTKDTLRGIVQYNVNYGVGFHNPEKGGIYVKDDGTPIFVDSSVTSKTLLHAGNYSNLLAGGRINGSITATSFIGNLTGNADSATKLTGASMNFTPANEALTTDQVFNLIGTGGRLVRGSWSFADNGYISSDTTGSVGIDLAGVAIISIGATTSDTNSNYTQLYLTAAQRTEEGTSSNEILLYSKNSNKTAWTRVLTDRNYSSYCLPLSGGTINGSITATSFIGNLTGNADSATKLATPRTIWGQSFDGSGNITGNIAFGADEKISWHNSPTHYYISSPATADAARLEYNSYGGHAFLGGNVAIGGTNASEKLHVHGNTQAFLFKSAKGYTLTSSETAYCGLVPNNAITSSGNNPTDFWLYNTTNINYYATKHTFLGGDVAIGDITATEKLHVHGNVKASGSMYATDFCTTSDNRLKDFTKDVIVDFNELKNIPKKYYYWKDKSMGEELQIGTSAQELAKVYPECVSYNEKEDRYSVNYQKLSIIALAAIDKLHERISVLEEKLNDQNS